MEQWYSHYTLSNLYNTSTGQCMVIYTPVSKLQVPVNLCPYSLPCTCKESKLKHNGTGLECLSSTQWYTVCGN